MKDEKEIRDDEIRIIGNDTPPPQPPVRRLWGWIAFGLATVVLVIVLVLAIWNVREVAQPDAETYFEPQPAPAATEVRAPQQLGQAVDSLADGFRSVLEGRSKIVRDYSLIDPKEKVVVKGDTVPLIIRQRNLGRFDRGLFNFLFIPKGQWSFGIQASYGEFNTDDFQMLSILNDLNVKVKAYSL